jgi:Flp pilus assembly protein TadG
MTRSRRIRHTRSAAAIVELACLLPFLIFLFLAAVDFCRIFYHAQTLQSCARSAALYACGGAVNPSSTNTQTAAQQAALAEGVSLSPPLQAQNVVITSDTVANTVTVTVTYSFTTLMSYPGVPNNTSIVKRVTMVVLPTT